MCSGHLIQCLFSKYIRFYFISVSVGFEYETCPSLILWEKRTALLQGFELDPSNLGGWSLDKHHVLNVKSGELVNSMCLLSYIEFYLQKIFICIILTLPKIQFLHSFCFIFSSVGYETYFSCQKFFVEFQHIFYYVYCLLHSMNFLKS